MVERKVKGLNKLTMEKFDSISDQIKQVGRRERWKDADPSHQTCVQKGDRRGPWSEMYASEGARWWDQEQRREIDYRWTVVLKILAELVSGGFQAVKEVTAAAAATKAMEDEAVKTTNEKKGDQKEHTLYSEEYYAAQKVYEMKGRKNTL
jgi:translation initiation factor 4G